MPEEKTSDKTTFIPFKTIGLCFSGGGYRATFFALGVMSFLEQVSYKKSSLLASVKALSTVSGGTLAGVGFAYIRKNSGLKPLIFGGEQERGYRAGTESVHNIVGLERSLTMAYEDLDIERTYVTGLKTYFIQSLKDKIPHIHFNGQSKSVSKSTYTLVNVCLPVAPEKGAMLLFQLDLKGIACSKGSACQSGSSQGSHVLNEILTEAQMQRPSVRFSFSIFNTKEEVDYVVSVLSELVNG